mmetsp:Transcript_131917/g.328971  ORF Transcript_131917/g.328971 Transcript_131917/m.328971 type:complete len:208 (+) Transcript_131917:888-1511(+)
MHDAIDRQSTAIRQHQHSGLAQGQHLLCKQLLQPRQGCVCAVQALMLDALVVAQCHDDDIRRPGSCQRLLHATGTVAVHVDALLYQSCAPDIGCRDGLSNRANTMVISAEANLVRGIVGKEALSRNSLGTEDRNPLALRKGQRIVFVLEQNQALQSGLICDLLVVRAVDVLEPEALPRRRGRIIEAPELEVNAEGAADRLIDALLCR